MPSPMQIERVTSAAQRVLDLRAEFTDFTRADLYDTNALLSHKR
jgi:hypothetical protein